MFLLDDILLAPAKGILFVFKEIHKQVIKEYYDEEKIYEDLGRLQYQLDIGEITEKAYYRMENALVKRLEEIEKYKETEEEEWDEEPTGE